MSYRFLQSFLNTYLICIFILDCRWVYIWKAYWTRTIIIPVQQRNRTPFEDQELLYLTWILARNSPLSQAILSWTWLNIISRKDVPVSKSLIGYLDCLDAPETENSTIHHLLCRSLITKEKLGLSAMVWIYDQAIFAKAVEIQFKKR